MLNKLSSSWSYFPKNINKSNIGVRSKISDRKRFLWQNARKNYGEMDKKKIFWNNAGKQKEAEEKRRIAEKKTDQEMIINFLT